MISAVASPAAGLAGLARQASEEAVALATSVLAEDLANQRWRDQLGPCLSQAGVAHLLGITPQAVAKRAQAGDLLRLVHRDGRPVYPIFQFHGRATVEGLEPVLHVLREVDDELTVAAWLTAAKKGLGGANPVDALRAGQAHQVLAVAVDFVARST